MKLYHSTATKNRESILKNGLVLRISNADGTEQLSITGGIFFSSKRPEPAEQIDIWEVDTRGLLVIEVIQMFRLTPKILGGWLIASPSARSV